MCGMRSGELAHLAGVSTDTLRHYESLGLLPAPGRTAGNYREYASQSVDRVRLIRNALAMGFSLKELGAIIQVRERGGAPCREVRRLADEKIAAITAQIEELRCYRDHLRRVVRQWDTRLRRTAEHERAHLLEAIAAPPIRPEPRLRWQAGRSSANGAG
jgi:DNA-binding transcriptional MerR regulator